MVGSASVALQCVLGWNEVLAGRHSPPGGGNRHGRTRTEVYSSEPWLLGAVLKPIHSLADTKKMLIPSFWTVGSAMPHSL